MIDNIKKNELNDLTNNEANSNAILKEEENNSFNQIKALQLLIQKHSGIKELCKYNIV